MKHVFPTDEIAHLWAHQTQEDARNKQGNFYFRNATIYSYGDHFPIATHVTNTQGDRAILLTTRGYSSTTAGHISQVRRAIPGNALVFNVALGRHHYDFKPDGFIEEYQERITKTEATARKARGKMEHHLGILSNLVAEANTFAAFYNLPNRFSLPADILELEAKAREYADKQGAVNARASATRSANRDAVWAARDAENARTAEENLTAWLNGESVSYWKIQALEPTRLRILGDEIETTKGARVPVIHAKIALAFVRRVKVSGQAYKANGHTLHIGYYAVDAIDVDGNLTAGCHYIPYSEIERIAPQLEAMEVKA